MFARYINLDARTDRRARMETLLQSTTVPIERFSAYKGSTDHLSLRAQAEYTLMRKHHHEIRSEGAIGCFLSHMQIWKDFLQSSATQCLVLEDDVDSLGQLDSVVEFFSQTSWDIALLGWKGNRIHVMANDTVLPWPVSEGFFGTHAYMLTRYAATLLLQEAYPIDGVQIDAYMQMSAWKHSLRIVASPKKIHQQWGTSNIQESYCAFCEPSQLFVFGFACSILVTFILSSTLFAT